jgi:hypothetical protein
VLGEQFTAANGLVSALFRQVDVHPAGELITGIPFALTVAEQNERRGSVSHGGILSSGASWLPGIPGHGETRHSRDVGNDTAIQLVRK